MKNSIVKKTLKSIAILWLLTTIFMLVGCVNEINELTFYDKDTTINYNNKYTNELDNTALVRESINFEGVLDYLDSERNLKGLEELQIYWTNNNINFDFYFQNNSEKNNIIKAVDFFVDFALSGKSEALGYGSKISTFFKENEFNDKICRIYIDGDLLIKHRYSTENMKIMESAYFENNLIELNQRSIFELPNEMFKSELKNISYFKNYSLTKAFQPFTLFMNIQLEDSTESNIKNYTENLLKIIELGLINENIEYLREKEISNIIITFIHKDRVIGQKKIDFKDYENILYTDHIW